MALTLCSLTIFSSRFDLSTNTNVRLRGFSVNVKYSLFSPFIPKAAFGKDSRYLAFLINSLSEIHADYSKSLSWPYVFKSSFQDYSLHQGLSCG